MSADWLKENKDLVLAVLKLVAIGAGAITATMGASAVHEGRARSDLVVTEAQAASDIQKAEKFGAFDNFRDFIIDVERKKARCDAAIEVFDVRPRARDAEDWKRVVRNCHSGAPR